MNVVVLCKCMIYGLTSCTFFCHQRESYSPSRRHTMPYVDDLQTTTLGPTCVLAFHTHLRKLNFPTSHFTLLRSAKNLEKMRLKLGFYQANWRNWRADSKHLTIWKQIRSFLSVSRETCRIKAWLRYWKANWMFGNSRANGTLSPLIVLSLSGNAHTFPLEWALCLPFTFFSGLK